MNAVVGRDRELAAIESFLDIADEAPRILLLEGEAGIGKSTLWRSGVGLAQERGYRLLSCTATRTESELSFTTLRDLLGDAFDEVADELPPPQRHALAVAIGELERARPLLATLEAQGASLPGPWTRARAARAAGLLAAAGGRNDDAVAAFERARAEAEIPLERGRTLLALGAVQRRARQRRLARETLEEARRIFEDLGAELWAEQVRAELARIGGRAAASNELTPSERRIAELVAEGKTNKEVAAALVVADRTVESALTQIYRKLDVRSRTELARKLTGA